MLNSNSPRQRKHPTGLCGCGTYAETLELYILKCSIYTTTRKSLWSISPKSMFSFLIQCILNTERLKNV